jgi:hypothetical protein
MAGSEWVKTRSPWVTLPEQSGHYRTRFCNDCFSPQSRCSAFPGFRTISVPRDII